MGHWGKGEQREGEGETIVYESFKSSAFLGLEGSCYYDGSIEEFTGDLTSNSL